MALKDNVQRRLSSSAANHQLIDTLPHRRADPSLNAEYSGEAISKLASKASSPTQTTAQPTRINPFRCKEDFNASLQELMLGREKVGQGAFGVVHEAKYGDRWCAVKLQALPDDDIGVGNLLAELSFLKSLQHTHLVEFLGAAIVAMDALPDAFVAAQCIPSECVPGVAIITGLAREGSLADALARSSNAFAEAYIMTSNAKAVEDVTKQPAALILPWFLRLRIARELASALKYLHSLDIIHRDCKTANVLLDRDFHVKLCDYGLAVGAEAASRLTHVGGTDEFMAPEMLLASTDGYGVSSDIFSLGLIFASLLHRDGGHYAAGAAGGGFLERSARTFFEVDETMLRAAAELPPNIPPPPMSPLQRASCNEDDIIAQEEELQRDYRERIRLAVRQAVIGLRDTEYSHEWEKDKTLEGQRSPIRFYCPPSFLELTVQCLQSSPDERPRAEDVEAWLEDLIEKDLAPLPPQIPMRRPTNKFEQSVCKLRRIARRWKSYRSSDGKSSRRGNGDSSIGYGKGKYETSPFSGLRQRGMKIVDTGLAEEQGKSQEVERKSNVGELKTNCIVIVGLLLIVLVIWENKVRQIQ
jgi:serine/threonine protein kinase